MTYAEKLKDPRWQKKRLEVMEYANWRCQICGGKDKTLHCHHSYYTRGKEPWQYPKGAIICICEGCHEKIHGSRKQSYSSKSDEGSQLPANEREMTAQDRFAAMRKLLRRQ
jgi:predicted HNH restriction endonuclease